MISRLHRIALVLFAAPYVFCAERAPRIEAEEVVGADGAPGQATVVKLKEPLPSFFTATVRAGCRPSNVIDLFGERGGAMRYARIRLEPEK